MFNIKGFGWENIVEEVFGVYFKIVVVFVKFGCIVDIGVVGWVVDFLDDVVYFVDSLVGCDLVYLVCGFEFCYKFCFDIFDNCVVKFFCFCWECFFYKEVVEELINVFISILNISLLVFRWGIRILENVSCWFYKMIVIELLLIICFFCKFVLEMFVWFECICFDSVGEGLYYFLVDVGM